MIEVNSQADDEVNSSQVDAFDAEPIDTDSLPLEEPNMEVPALADKTLNSKDVETSPSQKNGEPGSAASDVGIAPAGSVDGMSPSTAPTEDTFMSELPKKIKNDRL